MVEEILKLKENLEKRLDVLVSLNEASFAYLNDFFGELRREVDFDAETIIDRLSNGRNIYQNIEKRIASVHEIRQRYILATEKCEQSLLEKLETRDFSATSEKCTELAERIDNLFNGAFEGSKDAKMTDYEDRYEELALEILTETNELEKCLLDGQSFIYIESKLYESKQQDMGCLIYLPEDYLSKEEITCLK